MKEFNLKEAKAGKPVVTRDGHEVRIICFDRKGEDYPIVALIHRDNNENIRSYTLKGEYTWGSNLKEDLFMKSEKKEGWINIYKAVVYSSESVAKENANPNVVATIPIEWEE